MVNMNDESVSNVGSVPWYDWEELVALQSCQVTTGIPSLWYGEARVIGEVVEGEVDDPS